MIARRMLGKILLLQTAVLELDLTLQNPQHRSHVRKETGRAACT
jgi:hypothetical protein